MARFEQSNAALAEQPTMAYAHDMVAQRAAEHPEAIAISSSATELTYAELERNSNRLARHLRACGVTCETPVGLYFERTPDFFMSALAVMKAGGAYVPLDPAYPPARIDDILRDAGAPVLLSHRWMAANLPSGPWKTVDLDVDWPSIEEHSAEPLEPMVEAHNLAYIIYTSGSTGRPKGVEITHANLSHLIQWHTRVFAVTPRDRASQVAGLAFDATAWEMWCYMSFGASLHLIDEESRLSPEAMRDWMVERQITIAFVPTVLAEHMIAFDWPKETALRIMTTGGDALHRYPKPGLPFQFFNNYGPTECTVLVTSGIVPQSEGNEQKPTIGRPIDDTKILIMDADLNPVRPGEEGEICATGLQLGRGYRNLPELTAEKFVTEKKTGQRMYRTGDRGRILPDGQIAYVGRIDEQIKIRGYRIEPDEIVTQIVAHPSVHTAAVVARGEGSDDKKLLAFLVLAPGGQVTAVEMRDHLRNRLPDYMVPAAFVQMSSLPLNSSGKCDRKALPEVTPENQLPEGAGASAAPARAENPLEKTIAEIVSGLMNGRAVGREDNFFLIGGHSMLAAQLLARVRERLGVTLRMRDLFESPTITSLAETVTRKLPPK